jgi:hypothetical protein
MIRLNYQIQIIDNYNLLNIWKIFILNFLMKNIINGFNYKLNLINFYQS